MQFFLLDVLMQYIILINIELIQVAFGHEMIFIIVLHGFAHLFNIFV